MTSPHTLQIEIANGFWSRFRGLMLTPALAPDRALLITRCPSVHTLFMRYALDLAYFDDDGRVVRLVERLRPWRVSFGGPGATQVLELAAGGIARHAIRLGDRPTLGERTQSRSRKDRAALDGGTS